MILIADSGATKTDWRFINRQGEVLQAKTKGLSPTYQSTEEIREVISKELMKQVKNEVEEVYFYGAGCSSVSGKKSVSDAIRTFFPSSKIEVTHDLIAAARALCNKEPGIACILGTGSNSCLYNGEKIVANVTSLGFILGDEGSGSYMGKKLLADYFRENMPEELSEKLVKRYKITRDDVLEHVYKNPRPSFYLAKFSKFIFDQRKHPYMYHLIYQSFNDFFETNIKKYENYKTYKVHFVGSVAFYFNDVLRQVAGDHGLIVKNILESPIAGLTLFHKEELTK